MCLSVDVYTSPRADWVLTDLEFFLHCLFFCLCVLQRAKLEKVKLYEDKLLEAHTLPVRNYLLEHVMPTLSQGLAHCCQSQPQDPVDFLVFVSHLLMPVDL